MPDKRAVCSLADSIVFDYVPKKIRDIIERNVKISEDIKAVVRGMNDETLVITDQGVYTIKKEKVHFFSYEDILDDKYVHRVYRRGRFEIPLKGKGRVMLPDESKEPDFGPDPAPNVINFPWSKAELFNKAEQILSVNKELYDSKVKIASAPKFDEEKGIIMELLNEIKRLNEQIAKLKEEISSKS